ncbi:MAG: hypothetical protein NC433_02960 [Clostridiales bacterium]|nr:hypothetical protein [Clostridiales bacterium]
MEHENFTDNNKEVQDTEASLPAADSPETPAGTPEETTGNTDTEQKEIDTSGHNAVPDNSGSDKDASGDSNTSADSTGSPNESMSVSAPEASENKTEKETGTKEDTEKSTEKETGTKKDNENKTVSGNSLEDGKADENSENNTEASSIFTGAEQNIDYSDLSGIGEGITAILADNETYYTETLSIQKEIHEELQHVSFLLECTFTVACAVGFLIAVHVGGKLVDYFWNRLRG